MAEREPGDEGLAARLANVMGTGDPEGRKPVSLTEALYSRIVEVTREEVSQTTEVLGEVIVQLGRLERRVTALTTSLEGGAAPAGDAEAGPQLTELNERLGRLEFLLSGVETRLGDPAAAPRDATSVDLSPLEARLSDLSETMQLVTMRIEELAERPSTSEGGSGPGGPGDVAAVTQTITRGLSEVRTALLTAQPDLTPVLHGLQELRAAVAAAPSAGEGSITGPVDLEPLTEVTAQWLAEVRSAVGGSLDELRAALDRGPGLARLEEALQAGISSLQGSHQASSAISEAHLAELRQELGSAVADLRRELEGVQASLPSAEPVDLSPVTAAIAQMRDSLPPPVDLSPVTSAVAELRDSVPPPPDLTAVTSAVTEALQGLGDSVTARLDELAARVTEPTDSSEIVDAVSSNLSTSIRAAVSGGNDDLAAKLDDVRAAVAATGARFTAKMEELRNGLADDTEGLADRIDSAAERASRPVDLDPVVQAVQAGMAEVRGAIPPPSEPVDLTPLRQDIDRAVASLREAIPPAPEPTDLSPVLESLRALSESIPEPTDLTPVRQDIDRAIASLREAIPPAPEPTDLTPVREDIDRAVANLRAAIPPAPEPTDLSPVLDAVRSIGEAIPAPADLSGLDSAVAQVRAELASLRESVPPAPDLEPVVRAVHETADSAAEAATRSDAAVASLAEQLEAVRSAIGQQRDAILERLAAFEEDDDILAEVHSLMSQVAEDMRAVRSNNDPAVMLRAFEEGAEQAVERLAQSSEGLLARMDRRDAHMASLKVDIEQAVERSLRGLEADLAGVREVVAGSDRVARERFSELDVTMTELRGEVGMVRTLREAIDRMSHGVEGVKTLVQQADRGPEMQRVATGLSDVSRDLGATRERVLELDRSLAGLRTELSGTAEVAQASYQTADTLGALIPAVSSLENRIAAEVDELGRRIDSLASALQSTVAALPPPRNRGATQEKVASEVGERLSALREVAAGVSEAVRNDLKKRREKQRSALGSGKSNGSE